MLSPAWGMPIIGLFLLPFAAIGAATAGAGVWRLAQGNWREGLPLLVFGVVFAGFAAAGMSLMIVARRKAKELEQIQARHPDQPWLWRQDWAQGRIRDSTRAMVWVSWVFAGFWNLVSIPIGFVGVRTALSEGEPKTYLALLFPLVGCALLVWAVRLTLRHVRFGTSLLELSTIPGSIGRRIAGTVRIPSAVQPEGGFDATLSCVRRVTTRSGKNSSTTERILWQEEHRVRGEPIRDSAGSGLRVPVSFRIPADATASDSTNFRDQIVWRLTVSASVPGVDYHSSFEVPVFRTGEIPAQEEVADPGELPALEPGYRQPPSSRITVTRNQRGTEIYFGAARNPGVAVGSTIFTAVWTALVPLLVSWDAPAFFPIVFGLFAVLLIVGVLQVWLGVSRVLAGSAGVTVAQGYIAPGRERTIEAAHIADMTTKIGMQAGGIPYYDVVIVRRDGRHVIAGRSVRDKREAEWLVQTLKTAIGLAEPGASASSRPLMRA